MATDKIMKLETELKILRNKPTASATQRKEVDILNELASQFQKSDLNTAENYVKQALDLALVIKYQKGSARSYGIIGISYDMHSQYDRALEYYLKSLRISKKLRWKRNIGSCYHNLAVTHRKLGNYRRALEYEGKALRIFQAIGDKEYIANVYTSSGNIHFDQGNYSAALECSFKSLQINKRIRHNYNIAIVCNNIGNVFSRLCELKQALGYYSESLRIFQKSGYDAQTANAYLNIGAVYGDLKKRKNELSYILKAMKIFKKTGNKRGIAFCIGNIGHGYLQRGNYKKALEYFIKSLRNFEEIGEKCGIARHYMAIGETYKNMNYNNKALEYLIKALKISEEIGYKEGIEMSNINIGNIQIRLKHYKSALQHLRHALKITKEIRAKDHEMECYEGFCMLYKAQRDYKKALTYHNKYTHLKEEIDNVEKSKQITAMRIKYETEQKEKEAEIYRLKNVELRRENRKRKTAEKELNEHRAHLEEIVAERTAALKTINVELNKEIEERKRVEKELLGYQEQLRSLVHELSLVEEQQRRKIATNLHDSISQSLMIVKSNLELLSNTVPSKQVMQQVKEILSEVTDIIQRTRSMTFEISPPVLYELGLEPALEWLAETFQNQHGITCEFHDDSKDKPISEESRSILFQSARELLANVRKHAKANKVLILACREDNHIRITVKDDGVGFDPRALDLKIKKNEGFGLFNLRERLNYLQGKVEIDTKKGKGTKVTLLAPLKHDKKPSTGSQT